MSSNTIGKSVKDRAQISAVDGTENEPAPLTILQFSGEVLNQDWCEYHNNCDQQIIDLFKTEALV